MNGLDKGLNYQDSINSALWAACNSFRGIVSVDTYRGLILSMLFLKYLSDVWQDRYGDYEAEYDSKQELIEDEIRNVRFFLPSRPTSTTCICTVKSRVMETASTEHFIA